MAATQIFWQISELIMLVAEACVEPGPPPVITRTLVGRGAPHWRKGLGTIYALARTCQRSFYACIPVLWRTRFGIEKLACCLPPGVAMNVVASNALLICFASRTRLVYKVVIIAFLTAADAPRNWK
ncbi:hypothetical protein BC629DRAFT_565209 [Irpex lacteus]|nr:hypothetical protein BC629DRAFT_565209 [Irpex lacteus]